MKKIQDDRNVGRNIIVILLLVIGFGLRLYGADSIPLTYDENDKVGFANEIVLSGKEISLPMGSEVIHNPPLLPYLIKISFLIFQENKLALRLPSVILGCISLLMLFLLVKKKLNDQAAVIALFLMTFSQFSIGSSRIAWEDGVLIFFAVCVIFFAQTALDLKDKKYLFLSSIFAGLGLFTKGTFVTLLPPVIYYVFFLNKVFSVRDFFSCFFVVILILLPSVFWNINHHFPDYHSYAKEADLLTISLVPIAFMFGEIIIFSFPNISDATIQAITSFEYPFLNWLLGIMIFSAAIYIWKRNKNFFLRFCLSIFWFNFIFFSFVRPRNSGGHFFHLDNFWWAAIMIVPGIILAAAMMDILIRKNAFIKFLFCMSLFYFFINAFLFVRFPANCFIPRKNIRIQELISTAASYRRSGKFSKAELVNRYIRDHYGVAALPSSKIN